MSWSLADQIVSKIEQANALYYQIVLIVAPIGTGKTTALRHVHNHTGAPLVNVNFELSRRMLELTERQRVLNLPRLLQELVSDIGDETILLDNIEVIFDVVLKQDPLRLLQGLSRNKTVVAAWNGTIVDDHLTYAAPGHPEYRRYPMHDFLVVSPDLVM